MQSNERLADDGRHLVDRGGMRPVRVMNRGESQALCLRQPMVSAPRLGPQQTKR